MKRTIVMMLLMAFAAGTAQAALIAYEPFDAGADGDDVDATGGGIGWAADSTWVETPAAGSDFKYTAPGATFGDLEVSGLKATFVGNGTYWADYDRPLADAITIDASNPEVWVSVLVDLRETQSGRGIGIELNNGTTNVFGIGKGINKQLGVGPNLNTGSTFQQVSGTSTPAGTKFIAVRIAYDADADATVATAYVALGTEAEFDLLDVSTFTGSSTLTISGAVTFDTVRLYGSNGATATNSVDEIRIGDSYSDFFETELANTPTPGDNVSGINLTTDLEWQPPTPSTYTASGYDVWFGTEPNELNVAYDITQIAAKQAGTAVLNADLVAKWGAGLVNGQKYYWHVDAYEPNGLGDILHPGDLWSFTAIPPNVIINDDPVSVTVAAGGEAVFTVDASNATGYLWYKSTDAVTYTELTGETSASLTLSNVQQEDEGWYFCHVEGIDPQDSAAAMLMTERLVARYQFENNLDDTNSSLELWPGTLVDPNTDNAIPPSVSYSADDPNVLEGSYALKLDNLAGDEGGYVEVAGSVDKFNFMPQGITVCAWVKTTYSDAYTALVAKNGDVGEDWFLRKSYNGTLFRVGSSTPVYGDNITDGEWHFVVGRYDPVDGLMKIYSDGVEAGSKAITPDPAGNDALLTIGNESGSVGYDGWIDDVQIYSYALTPEVIAQMYFDVTGKRSCIYEFGGATVDLNGDCIVDIADVAMLAGFWLDNGLYPAP